jgi:hypothetical protein
VLETLPLETLPLEIVRITATVDGSPFAIASVVNGGAVLRRHHDQELR